MFKTTAIARRKTIDNASFKRIRSNVAERWRCIILASLSKI
jgi:hypothetical protein